MPKYASELVEYVRTFLERTYERCRTSYMEVWHFIQKHWFIFILKNWLVLLQWISSELNLRIWCNYFNEIIGCSGKTELQASRKEWHGELDPAWPCKCLVGKCFWWTKSWEQCAKCWDIRDWDADKRSFVESSPHQAGDCLMIWLRAQTENTIERKEKKKKIIALSVVDFLASHVNIPCILPFFENQLLISYRKNDNTSNALFWLVIHLLSGINVLCRRI